MRTTFSTPISMSKQIVVLPGDHIGSEVTEAAVQVLNVVLDLRSRKYGLSICLRYGLIGGAAIDSTGTSQ
jgi:3-isopropylmalate dehydrogenase